MLSRIDDSFKIQQFFEFVLVYPELQDYLQWNQTVNPIHAQPNTDNGYQRIRNPFTDGYSFSGLSLSNSSATLIDGSPFEASWFYGIGLYGIGLHAEKTIPGPNWVYNGKSLSEVRLYIKIIDTSLLGKLYSYCTQGKNYLSLLSFRALLFNLLSTE